MSARKQNSIRRFSKIKTEKDAPYFQLYSSMSDPVQKHERKFKKAPAEPDEKKSTGKQSKKGVSAKEKKTKEIEAEEKKIQKYVAPVPRAIRKQNEERHKKEKEMWYVCKKDVLRVPSPITVAVVEGKQLAFESPYKHGAEKVVPTKFSLTDSMNKWPRQPTTEELEERKPKTGIYINRTRGGKKIEDIKKPPVDSIDYIYEERYRKGHPWYVMYRASDEIYMPQLEIEEAEEEEDMESGMISIEQSAEEVKTEGLKIEKYLAEEEDVEESPSVDISLLTETKDVDKPEEPSDEEKKAEPVAEEHEIKLTGSQRLITDRNKSKALLSQRSSSETEGLIQEELHLPSLESVGEGFVEYEHFKSQYRYSTAEVEMAPSVISRILQKYHRESEILVKPSDRVLFKRGTINSHSTSKIRPKLKSFYFGVVSGSMHLGDETFSERSRFRQGFAMAAVAYCYSFVKMPVGWNSRDIDRILIEGDKLYLKSLEQFQMLESTRVLLAEELCDVVELLEKKFKYKIDEPDVAGMIKSEDPKVYDLLKGLTLFFQRNRAGILHSYDTNILIWRQKQYFVFDPMPRTQELYFNEEGFACLANFYDLSSAIIMLLDRGYLENWPYVIARISIKKILGRTQPDVESTTELRCDSRYRIVSQDKAVTNGTINLSNSCFGTAKNKQGYATAIIAIIYSKITPSCAWVSKTVDKIILVANQFYLECAKMSPYNDMKLDDVPAFFTIGPLMAEILIYVNQYAGLMYNEEDCIFAHLLEKCFETNSEVIIEIDKFVVAVWEQRGVYYMFDPYSRDHEGLKCTEGTGCVTMNENINSVVQTILFNFNIPEYIFKMHVLKVIKIHKDPEFGKPGRPYTSEEILLQNIKLTQDAAGFKCITIDPSETAIRETKPMEQLPGSLIQIESNIGSLDKKYVPICEQLASETDEKMFAVKEEKIYNLDSPSLSDTQIEKEPPSPMRKDSFEFRLLDEIIKEEMEIDKLGNYGEEDYYEDMEELNDIMLKQVTKQSVLFERRDVTYETFSAEVNTKLMGLRPLPKEVLEPSRYPRRHRKIAKHTGDQKLETDHAITQSQELLEPSNFISLPDGSEILYGTQNVTAFGDDFEEIAPFVSVMAVAMAKKYTLTTWTKEVVDAILNSGSELQKTIEVKFADAPKIKIPKVTIGTNSFSLTIDYIFDSLLEPTILKTCLEKLVFKNIDSAIIVTKIYSVAVFYKRFLFYMFDGFGNDLVGLGKGLDNTGFACMFRFKNINALVSRFMYNKKQREKYEPTRATRFVLSSVEVKVVFAESPKQIPRRERQLYPKPEEEEKEEGEDGGDVQKDSYKEPKNRVGFYIKNRLNVLEGSDGLSNRTEGSGYLKMCYMVSACAIIGLFNRPITVWDTKRVDYILISGKSLFDFTDDTAFSDNRSINGLLIDKHFYDIIIKQLVIANPKNARSFAIALKYVTNKHKFLMLQLPSCCYALYKTDKFLHLFDSYGVDPENPKACWIRFKNERFLRNYVVKMNQENIETFFFYTMSIVKMRRASKKGQLQYKLGVTNLKPKEKTKKLHILHEHEDWLKVYPIPWSLVKKTVASGAVRASKSNFWYSWNIEYPNDLYSLFGTIHQTSDIFAVKNRGRQTIANCIVAIVMTEIYDFSEWNSEVLDSILKSGDAYFTETFKSFKEKNYEIKIEDFKTDLSVFPYKVNIDISPLFEGTMFLFKPDQFNLSKALRFFFESHENRCGIVCNYTGTSQVKFVAFGRIRKDEYFMYDCQTSGPPMFLDRFRSTSYMLRCLSLNRLLHIMTLTLRSGDFFVYYVGLSENQNEQITGITNYDEEGEGDIKSEEATEEGGEENAEELNETAAPAAEDNVAAEEAEG